MANVPLTGIGVMLTSQQIADPQRAAKRISAMTINDGNGNEVTTASVIASMTDARTPTAHKATHAAGGTDALSPADLGIGAASDTAEGLLRIATDAEAQAGTATGIAVTPAQLKTYGGGSIKTYTTTITGDGTTTEWAIDHNLGTNNLVWIVTEADTGTMAVTPARKASANQLVLSTRTAVAEGKQYAVSIVGF
jgi:hypothetical protein